MNEAVFVVLYLISDTVSRNRKADDTDYDGAKCCLSRILGYLKWWMANAAD